MATYVDGYVLTVKKSELAAYKKMAKEACQVWRKFGAIDYKECVIDDATPKHVKLAFPKMIGAKPDETVFFSYIVFKSKTERNKVNKQVMAYFDEKYKDQKMPITMRRFSYAGFTTVVE